MLGTALGRLRVIGWVEGISFLALLGIAMPLKYMMGMPVFVRWVGLFHGIMWMLYIGGLMRMYLMRSWPVTLLLGGILGSVLPFGPFVFDRYLPKDVATTESAADPADVPAESPVAPTDGDTEQGAG